MKRIPVPEDGVETFFGAYDENLKHLESLFNVRIRTQGHELLVDGDTSGLDSVDRVVGQLSSLMKDGYKLSNADVKTASDLVARTVVVVNAERRGSEPPEPMRRHFEKRCARVVTVPWDEALEPGALTDMSSLHRRTRDALVDIAAAVADNFVVEATP